jgi:integrase
METISMSGKERRRLEVFSRVKAREFSLTKAAERLGISGRQAKRIWARYRDDGDAGLVHRLRGRASNRQSQPFRKEQALELYREKYAGYGPTLAAERLERDGGLVVPKSTLRRWLSSAGVWQQQRRRKLHRRRRPRREHDGELVQLDGSHHDGFEGCGGLAVLMVMIDACPDAQWRLIVALSRYGGLRCPSEHLALTRDDIDWERGRMTVRSPKTEHHAGGESRIVPLFPELRPYLDAAWDLADPGKFVITRYRDKSANLRTQLLRIIKRAGLKPWPRLFHNMRASRQTELTARFPLHVVCEWIGNSALIADKHYLQVTDEHYADAGRLRTVECCGDSQSTGKAAQKAREMPSEMPFVTLSGDTPQIGAFCTPVPPTGVEPVLPD